MPSSSPATPRQLPVRPLRPPVQRRFRFFFFAFIALVAAATTWQLITGGVRIIFEGPWLGGFAFVATALVLTHHAVSKRIARKFLAPHAGFICPCCHYPLSKLADEGVCPECGCSYTRPQVLSIWEQAYGLGRRYPRESARSSKFPTSQPPAPKRAPWAHATLAATLDDIDSAAKANGCRTHPFPPFALELKTIVEAQNRRIPIELFIFLSRVDPKVWSWVVNPSREPAKLPGPAEPADPTDLSAGFAALGGPAEPLMADPIVIRPPSMLRFEPFTAEAGATGTRIEFAQTSEGRAVSFVVGTGPPRDGSLVMTEPDNPQPTWLAASLAQWLARLITCRGIDPLLTPDRASVISAELRNHVEAERAAQQQVSQPPLTPRSP